jgi:hypothetical protein
VPACRHLTAVVSLFAVLATSGCALLGIGGSGVLPNLVGMQLDEARTKARTAGFSHVALHDATGGGRRVIRESNWMVCFQTPAAGSKDTGGTVDLGVVKRSDECPAKDESGSAPTAPAGTMPDLRGASLNAAQGALPSGTVVTPTDLDGGHTVMVKTHWKICTQNPAPGAPLASGQKVSLGVVKLGGGCPSDASTP